MKTKNLLVIGIFIVFIIASCVTSEKAQTAQSNIWPCDSIKVMTTGLQDSNKLSKFTIQEWQAVIFYLSQPIVMHRKNSSITPHVENGVIVVTDSLEEIIRTFDYRTTSGKIVGTPQKNPGASTMTSFSIHCEDPAHEISYDFIFNIEGNSYVLKKEASVLYQGQTFQVDTYNPELTGQVGKCKLLACLMHNKVINIDHK